VQLQRVEREGVASGFGRATEELTHQDSCVNLHLCGYLVAEERREDEVELTGFAEALDSCVAKTDALLFGFGDERDVGVGGERDAEAGAADGGTELRFRVNVDDDAILDEGDVGRLGVDVAGRGGVSADVVTALWAVEELGAKCALQCLRGDFDLDGRGRAGCREQKSQGKQQVELGSAHVVLKIMADARRAYCFAVEPLMAGNLC